MGLKVETNALLAGTLGLSPLNSASLRDQAYVLLKDAIATTDIYSQRQDLRLDERQLTQALGVSRTPVREALTLLEQEGFKLPTSPSMLPPTQWFSSEDGLEAVSDLHEYLEAHITYLGDDTAAAVQELEEYMTVLEKASARNLRWHLAVSWR